MKTYSGGIRHDYSDTSIKPLATNQWRWPWFLLGFFLPLIAVSIVLINETDYPEILSSTSQPIEVIPEQSTLVTPGLDKTLSNNETPYHEAPEKIGTNLTLLVKNGENLDILFRRNNLSLSDLATMTQLPGIGEYLKIMMPGDVIQITHKNGEILSLERELDEIQLLDISRGSAGFEANIISRELDFRKVGANGIIQTSLFEAGQIAGISDLVTMNMAGIFQWDIDFIQDVRIGDEFTVVHEELWREGVKIKDGEIIAAEFINQGTSYRAVRYKTDEDSPADYFTPEGLNVRKAFIRAPVDFKRISSSFNLNRRHPILNKIRAHRGVDYAAPTGTPVKAAGDGKITFRGTRDGYGNTVILQHGNNITTLYGHMSRFAASRIGGRVEQGEVIGFVGQSGLATGPHLHYEYRLGGVHRNPRTVPLPPADPIPTEHWKEFQIAAEPLWRQLDLYRGTRLTQLE